MNPLVIDIVAVDQRHALRVELRGGFGFGIEKDELAACHAVADLVFGGAEDEDPAACHVLAGVFAGGLGDDGGSGVSDAESVSGPAADEDETAGGPVADVVAG